MARRPPRGFGSWHSYNEWRVRRGIERGLSPEQARGHPKAGERRASEVERDVRLVGPTGVQVVTVRGVRELSRAGAADDAVRRLTAGDLTPTVWNRRWANKTIGGVALPRADRVLALARAGLASFDDFYPTGPSGVAA
jgi:hypothetical protein